MASFVTLDSLKRLERQIDLHSGPFIDFVQGMILQKRIEWFQEHRPLSKQIVQLVSSHKGMLPYDALISITSIFLSNGWLSGLKEDSLNLFGTTQAIAYGYGDKVLDVFNHYVATGNLPESIAKQDFFDLAAFGKQLQNPLFYKAVISCFSHYLSIKEDAFDLIPIFKGHERQILQAYFSKKGVDTMLKESRWFFPFFFLAKLFQDPAYPCALSFIDVVWINEKTDPAEAGLFSFVDSRLKGAIKEVLIDGYLDPIEPILKHLSELKVIIFVDCKPSTSVLSCLMGIAFKLERIEFTYQEINEAVEHLEVSSALFNFLQSKKVNFSYRKISSVRA